MAAPTRPPANGFVAKARKVYNPIGFSKGYNFILWFIFAGAMFGFALARMMFLNYNGIYCNPNSAGNGAGPGECWSYNRKNLYKTGIKMHLYTIIPASFLVVFQFVPFIRYKALLFHRMNGYIVVVLAIIGTVGAIIIAPVAFGGSLSVRAAVGLMSIMFLGSLFLAIWNIKTLQLEQHRAWMLRAWFYVSFLLTSVVHHRLKLTGWFNYHFANNYDHLCLGHVQDPEFPTSNAMRQGCFLLRRHRVSDRQVSRLPGSKCLGCHTR